MKLYDAAMPAPNPRRVRMFLAEKNITDVPLEPVNLMKGESRSPELMAKNILGGIPFLELDDGTVIGESLAICRYFEELQPQPPLFGTGALEKATIDMWCRKMELNFMVPVGQVWIHGHPLTAKLIEQVPAAADFNRARLAQFYPVLDGHLASNDYIAGASFSVADIVALSVMDFGCDLVGVPYDAELVNIQRWRELVQSRPSAGA